MKIEPDLHVRTCEGPSDLSSQTPFKTYNKGYEFSASTFAGLDRFWRFGVKMISSI